MVGAVPRRPPRALACSYQGCLWRRRRRAPAATSSSPTTTSNGSAPPAPSAEPVLGIPTGAAPGSAGPGPGVGPAAGGDTCCSGVVTPAPCGTTTRSSTTSGSSSDAVNLSPARFRRVSIVSLKRTRTLVPAGRDNSEAGGAPGAPREVPAASTDLSLLHPARVAKPIEKTSQMKRFTMTSSARRLFRTARIFFRASTLKR